MRKKKRRHWHDPQWWHGESEGSESGQVPQWRPGGPWKQWEHWEHDPPFRPRWATGRRHHSDKLLFARFAMVFGLFVLLGCGVLAVLAAGALLFFFMRTPEDPSPGRFIFPLLFAVFLLALALWRVGTVAAKRFTMPLSETMKAADAMAAGDLSARVPEEGSGDFRHFAGSFNRMAGALQTADRQRRELLADVAHELRTPLTVIQGNLEGLRDGVYEASPEHLDLVLDETRKVGRLVDDLRLLTLAEAGQLPLDLQILDVRQLLTDVRDSFACRAGDAGVALVLDVPDALPPLAGDPQRLGQVLGNLLANALRHTPAGGQVTLTAALDPDDPVPSHVLLRVADNGQGIPAEDLPRIFDRFWRGDPARSHGAGAGSGLGLAIAKGLVEAHGGGIWAESRVGEGTTISLGLPLSLPASQ